MTVSIEVLLFAGAKDACEQRTSMKLDFDVPGNITIQDMCDRIVHEYTAMRPILQCSAIAVNEEYVEYSSTLNNGDTVAIIPPVSK